jgi:hypothetical protein
VFELVKRRGLIAGRLTRAERLDRYLVWCADRDLKLDAFSDACPFERGLVDLQITTGSSQPSESQ